jgi:hypothetical protein
MPLRLSLRKMHRCHFLAAPDGNWLSAMQGAN